MRKWFPGEVRSTRGGLMYWFGEQHHRWRAAVLIDGDGDLEDYAKFSLKK